MNNVNNWSPEPNQPLTISSMAGRIGGLACLGDELVLLHNAAGVHSPLSQEAAQLLHRPGAVVDPISFLDCCRRLGRSAVAIDHLLEAAAKAGNVVWHPLTLWCLAKDVRSETVLGAWGIASHDSPSYKLLLNGLCSADHVLLVF